MTLLIFASSQELLQTARAKWNPSSRSDGVPGVGPAVDACHLHTRFADDPGIGRRLKAIIHRRAWRYERQDPGHHWAEA